MQKRLISILIIGTLLLVPINVSAQSTVPLPPDEAPSEVTTTAEGTVEEARQRLQERISERRNRLRSNLDNTRRQLLARTCTAAQNALGAVATAAQTLYRSRVPLHTSLSERLDAIIARLNANHADIDTGQLETVSDELDSMVEDFTAELEVYIVALDAAVNDGDCSDAPAEFHDVIETARELRSELLSSSQSIKSYMQNELKQAVTDIRDQLADESA